MTNLKTLFATLIALATLSSAGTVFASPIILESVLIREAADTVTVDFGSKIRGCAWLLDDDGYRVQGTATDFCGSGANQVIDFNLADFDVEDGDVLTLCAQGNINLCSNSVVVRKAGDVNDDGHTNVIDFMMVHDYILEGANEIWPHSRNDVEAADMNGDGAVNVIDILLLIDQLWAEAAGN